MHKFTLIIKKMIKPGIAIHPWEYLLDALKSKWWSQTELSEIIWISRFEINDIIKWRRNITPRIAFRLWEAFWNSWSTWLNLQNLYDLSILEQSKEEIEQRKFIRQKVWELAYA